MDKMVSDNFYLGLESFRCFAKADRVRIAPITILVGENSTGKTSFLAAVRRSFESLSFSTGNLFNKEPYFLGSFEQISHFRGGKAGRAKSFSIEIEIESGEEVSDLFVGRRKSNHRKLAFKTTFKKGKSQPEISEFEVASNDTVANFRINGQKLVLNIVESGVEVVQSMSFDIEDAPFSSDPNYLLYFALDMARQSFSEGQISEVQFKIIQKITHGVNRSNRGIRKRVFASAPVRIQPKRVYTPSELTSANAGEQVPLQMANQKLVSPLQWRATKSKLIEFGSRAGLFEDIDVKRFGKSDGDPFQLQVKNLGPAANIVDVGYGVSQALPLIYPLYAQPEIDVFLLQQPEVHLHPRAQAEFGSLVAELSRQNPNKIYVIETHSDFVIDRIRSEIRNGNLDNSTVNIVYFKKNNLEVDIFQIDLDDNGGIRSYPEHYREFFLREQARILGV